MKPGEIKPGTKCELCGMLATSVSKDDKGITHYYCEHHLPDDHYSDDQGGHGEHSGEHDKGFNKHEGHSVNMFRDKFWLSLLLTIPVVLYSGIIKTLFNFEFPSFPGSSYLPLIFSTIIFFYGGWVFVQGAVTELKFKLPGMMTLISMAITVAFVYSLVSQLVFKGETLFWELSTLITIMLLGHWLEMRSVGQAQGALGELAKLLPDKAIRLVKGEPQEVAVSELSVGDLLLVKPGAKVPADGLVQEGESSVDESMITGESKPVIKKEGEKVVAGTINAEGSLKVKVTGIGENTALAGIMRLVAEAQASKSKTQILADKAAYYLTIIAIGAGILTFFGWLSVGSGVGVGIERLVGVLVIACPHALGLAIPLVTSISTSLSAKNGILVRDRLSLEEARKIDVVLFDKTGTLTKGEQGVTDIMSLKKGDETEIVALAASVEAESEHFIARGVVQKAKQLRVPLEKLGKFKSIPGKGVSGEIGSKKVEVGNLEYLKIKEVKIPEVLEKEIKRVEQEGKTVVFVLVDSSVIGALALQDLVREESKEAVKELKEMGVRVAMITGDSEAVAKEVSKELGIDEYFAHVLPEHKADKVNELQIDGSKVAMVGDGVNDAPALTKANIGIAIGAGTDVAIESAGIILVKNDPRDVVKIIKLSRATYNKMIQNLFWAAGYNVIAIPLAAGVLASVGIILAPAFGAVLMSASTVIVAANAQLLRNLKLSR